MTGKHWPGVLSHSGTDWAASILAAGLGIAAFWSPWPWAAAVLLPLAICSVAIPAYLRRDLSRRERALMDDELHNLLDNGESE